MGHQGKKEKQGLTPATINRSKKVLHKSVRSQFEKVKN
tara:strand:- start:1144 stop:1257 length:114 start_codon:yes stop_codon:yes gene_type:complete